MPVPHPQNLRLFFDPQIGVARRPHFSDGPPGSYSWSSWDRPRTPPARPCLPQVNPRLCFRQTPMARRVCLAGGRLRTPPPASVRNIDGCVRTSKQGSLCDPSSQTAPPGSYSWSSCDRPRTCLTQRSRRLLFDPKIGVARRLPVSGRSPCLVELA